MKIPFRPWLICTALAGFVPLAFAALAENPPVAGDGSPAAVAAAAPSATPSTVAPDSPASAPHSDAAAAAPAAPGSEAVTTAPAGAAASATEPALRKLDAAPAAPEAAAPAPSSSASIERRARRHSGRHDRVSFGGNAELGRDEVAESVVAIGGNATAAGEVTDSVVAVLGNARATGPVSSSVVAVLGNVYVDSPVGEVVAVLGNVELGPNAEVRRDVVAVAGKVKRDPHAIVHGDIPNVSVGSFSFNAEWLQSYLRNCLFKARLLGFGPNLAWAWYVAIGFLALYVLIGLLFGDGIAACSRTLETRPGGSVLAALLTVLLTPVLMVLLGVTVVGLAAVPFIAMGLMVATLFGKAVMLAWLGGRVTRLAGAGPLSHPAFAVLVGGVIVLALYLVPVVALIVYKLLGVLGLGVVVYTLLLASKRDKRLPAAPAPAYSAPLPPAPGAEGAGLGGGVAAVAADPAVASAVPPVAVATLTRAGFWIRMGALLIDVILVGIVGAVFPRWMHLNPPGLLLLLALYGALLWKLKGSTVGGIVCGLKVVRIDGREIDWATALVRALGCFLSLVVAGLGFIWIAIDDEKQSWHDKIAGTAVVHARGTVSLV